MRKSDVLKILTIVFAVLDILVLICGGAYLITASKTLKAINLSADFTETELAINSQYTFNVGAVPKKASLKKAKFVCDDPGATFELGKNGKATLTTGGSEGTVTVYVEYKKIKSDVLTFQVVDLVARAQAEAEAQAQAQAEEEAAAAAEAETEEQVVAKVYVKMKGDNVNVRSQNNTDCSVLGKAKQGEVFEVVETVDDWTHIIYNGQDGYIKSEYLTEISEEEYLNGGSDAEADAAAEEAKKAADEAAKKAADEAAKKAAEDAAKQAADEAAKKAAEEAAQKAAEEAAAAQRAAEEAAAAQKAAEEAAAAQAAQQAAAAYTINCKDGVQSFTAQQYNFIKGFWSYTGEWETYAHKHTKSELLQICQIEGGIN